MNQSLELTKQKISLKITPLSDPSSNNFFSQKQAKQSIELKMIQD